ncbi:MAG: hypothetical protein COT55_02175 [Candidatus Diapherotrites archaeon CG09_land_8_20_14_0_10_32_12]|nr:MAG: hypothetical protein COT55_02175 [Candidatus Diapherotrites archaeon CG09_land_8_20_14_0_10_32_12]
MDQREIMEFNNYSNQMNMLNAQTMNVKGMMDKIKENIDELNKSKETHGYKNLGLVLIKKPKVDLVKELEETKKSLDLRLKTIDKQEKIVSAKLEELKTKFELEQKKQEEKKDKK